MTLALVACAVCASAQKNYVDPNTLTFGDNLEQPVVPRKAAQQVRDHMATIQKSLANHYDNVETIRNGEIVVVTIPASKLFMPNDTVIKETGKMYLRPFVSMMKYPTMYKLLVTVHSDDTGEPDYRDHLTEVRADAIDQFLQAESYTSGNSLVPFGLSSEDPEKPNNTVANRATNRRVEIYIVPEWQMVESAKSGKLK